MLIEHREQNGAKIIAGRRMLVTSSLLALNATMASVLLGAGPIFAFTWAHALTIHINSCPVQV